ncbi:sensor histidine kinase [Cryobacterium sp. MLB-32]|uniref:sensor histidine kinase n=1 Tax=Cryobacterium sp. MLB-32 TaxID=1529318 RepID=UPI00068B5B60|nr:ATP-binding protein [Cryobacterium sp. MLB-32]
MSKAQAADSRVRPVGRGDELLVGGTRPRNSLSRAQIETVLSRSVAGISVIFALQSLPAVLHQFEEHASIGTYLMAFGLGLAVACVVFATVFKRGVRVATSSLAIVYLLALAAWPIVVSGMVAEVSDKPWLWYLCTVATSCAAIGFSVRWAAIYTVVAPVVYGVVRMEPSGGQADLLLASLDVLYAVLLGQVVLIIITMLRTATSNVDQAQSNALAQYSVAVRQHATEVERVEVDSIVHDSVLATLLSAAGARTEKGAELAATMAANAVDRLLEASAARPDDEARIPFHRLGIRLRHEAAASSVPFTFVDTSDDAVTVPEQVSDALFAAALQAMVNSVQHAGTATVPVKRALTLSATPEEGCRIEIADAGVGFDSALVPTERLGLRVSIQERVTSVGGFVCVRTSVGKGTIITLQWPRPDDQPPLEVDELDGIPSIELDDPGNETGLLTPGGVTA